jgi:ribose 1,5-bisphosphokinase
MATLFYIIGASGVGKDALMQYARQAVNGAHPVVFAHRYITRPADAGGENHIALTPEEFALRRDGGLFALHWESHGNHYGIGIEIDAWMGKGCNVAVNGSRAYLPEALKHYPAMQPILIEADPEVIRRRLEGRGRETKEEVRRRLDRTADVSADSAIVIRNDGALEEAGNRLTTILTHHQLSRT